MPKINELTRASGLARADLLPLDNTSGTATKGVSAALIADFVISEIPTDTTPTANSENYITSGGVAAALAAKQGTLTFDDAPTNGSNNPVKSDGVYDADEAIRGSIAPAYSTSNKYAVGDYVMYNGSLYCCNTAISSGESWNAAHWTAAKLATSIAASKGMVDGLFSTPYEPSNLSKDANGKPFIEYGYVNASTGAATVISSSSVAYQKYMRTQAGANGANNFMYIGDKPVLITLGLADVEWTCWSYSGSTNATATHSNCGGRYVSSTTSIFVPHNDTDVRMAIGFRTIGSSDSDRQKFTEEQIAAIKNNLKMWVFIDDTLSVAGAAADAKATGDMILINEEPTDKTRISITTTDQDIELATMDDIAGAYNGLESTCNIKTRLLTLYVSNNNYYYFDTTKFYVSGNKKNIATRYVNDLNSAIAFELRNNDYMMSVNYFDETGAASTSSATGWLGSSGYKQGVIYLPKEAVKFLINYKRVDGAALSAEDLETIRASLYCYYAVDKTLSVANVAADAVAVGNFKASFDRSLTTMYEKTVSVSWFSGAINITTGGNVNYSESDPKVRIRSDYITIANGMKITVPDGLMVRVGIYTSVGGSAGFKGWLDTEYWTGEKIFNNPVPMEATVFRILARYEPEAEIDTSAGSTVAIKRYSFKDPFIEIPQNADLNDYSTPGCYYSLNTATTETLSNCPIPDTAFRLDVVDAKYRGYGSIRQILVKAGKESDGFFMRYNNGTTWGNWDHYTPSKAIYTPNIIYPNVKVHSQRTSANVVARYRVGTYNVAHYRMNQGVNSRDYISEHPDAISNWRRWVMKSNLDFLFVTEDSVYIDEAQTKLATDYLYNPYFFKNDNVSHSHRLLTKTNFDTSSLTELPVPNVNTNPGAISTYYIDWCIIGGSDDPKILMAVIHNFAAMSTVGTEEQIKQNRANYCAAIKTLLTNQSGNYDYVIIAGDTNVGNYVTKTTANREYDMALFETLCEDTNMHLVNGDEIGWFKTDPESNTDADVYDNIIVSNNIRVENIECSPFEYEVLWSDHVPVIAELSLLG